MNFIMSCSVLRYLHNDIQGSIHSISRLLLRSYPVRNEVVFKIKPSTPCLKVFPVFRGGEVVYLYFGIPGFLCSALEGLGLLTLTFSRRSFGVCAGYIETVEVITQSDHI